MFKIKKALGMQLDQEESFFTRAKDKLGHLFTGADPLDKAQNAFEDALSTGKQTIDSVLRKIRESTPENREQLFGELKKAINDASRSTQEKSSELYKLVGGKSDEKMDIGSKFSAVYHSLQQTVDSWMKQAAEYAKYPSTYGQYLLQSSKQENGLSQFYVNDNGQERLDVTGEQLQEKNFDKLQSINEFRRELNLEPHSSLPESASVQVHTVKRPHVFVKAIRMIDGNKFEYSYDDGQETLTTEWHDSTIDKHLSAEETQHLLRVFRQDHGLSLRPHHDHSTELRTSLVKKVKDDL